MGSYFGLIDNKLSRGVMFRSHDCDFVAFLLTAKSYLVSRRLWSPLKPKHHGEAPVKIRTTTGLLLRKLFFSSSISF